ncbi:hypothetical protein [Pontibacter amylolyticus]|nr:hypothetical protein [Pontibacter amylolyticus]
MKQKVVPGAPLTIFCLSGQRVHNRLDFFASFFHQGKKEGPPGQGKL